MRPYQPLCLNGLSIFWEHSPLWLIPCFILALIGAWFLYSNRDFWPVTIRWGLFSLRTLLLFFILALLLNPLIRNFKEAILPPISVILVDNSQSVVLGSHSDSLSLFQQNIKLLKSNLENQGSQVIVSGLDRDFSGDSAISFQEKKTDLNQALKRIQNQFDNQNLTQVILASDGIFNLGADPQQSVFPFTVHTILLGNPVSRKDLLVSQVRSNKVAFLGNTFPILVQIRGRKLAGNQVLVDLMENNQILQTKSVTLSPNEFGEVEFQLKASSKGIHQYQVSVRPVEGELTLLNNKRSAYVEVIDGKQKVLLVAAAPHPDIKALRSAIQILDQVDLVTVIGSQDEWKPGSYNLVLLHQLPDRWGTFGPQVSQFLKGNTPIWVFAGPTTDFNRLRSEAGAWMNVQGYGAGSDEVTGLFHSDFQRFTFEENWKTTLHSLPPIGSPSASFQFRSPFETILQQKLGKATTATPLLAVDVNSQPKRGVFWGDGLWLWRLNDFALNQNTNAVDNLILKTTQLLLSSDKKQQLKVFLNQTELLAGEQPQFISETYNQVFEPIFNQKINLEIRRQDGNRSSYSFFNTPSNSTFLAESLTEGAYRFSASTQIGGKVFTDAGEFVVRPNELESRELEANHLLLQNLSKMNSGNSVGIHSMAKLAETPESKAKPIIEFTDWDENILNKLWILGLLIVLTSIEWFVRKWNGSL